MKTALQSATDIERMVGKAYLTAHLLTASSERAKNVTLEAIHTWDPGDESGETLFRKVLDGAARPQASEAGATNADSLPAELQAVLKLTPLLRRCFVLRFLVGLSPQVCAQLLHLHSLRVDEYTSIALRILGATERLRLAPLQFAV